MENIINIPLEEGDTRRLLCITDMHLRDVDFKSIQGFKSNGEAFIFNTLIPKLQENEVTDVMFLGDIADKGYRNVGAAYSHMSLIESIKSVVPGVFGTILGNHFFIETQSNPELYWIQPHPIYKPTEKVYRTEQILSTPDIIRIGNTQISCFHFNPNNKEYIKRRLEGIHTHIGLYHDDVVVPPSIRMYGASASGEIARYYSNIDIAVHGHIHVPHGTIYTEVGNKSVPLIIPGSCALTSSDKREFHNSVKLPLFTITNEKCELSFVTLSIGAQNYRIFKKKEPQKEIMNKVREIRQQHHTEMQVDTIANFIRSNNLPTYYIDYVKRAAEHSLTASALFKEVLNYQNLNLSIKELEFNGIDDTNL